MTDLKIASGTNHAPKILRKRELFQDVILQTGVRNGEARAVMEALLSHMHAALSDHTELHIPPLGKIRVIQRITDDGLSTHYKVNLMKAEKL